MSTTLQPAEARPALADRTSRQLAAVQAFHEARRAAEQSAAAAASSREMQMDNDRRLEVLRREHQAIVERAEHAIRSSAQLLRPPVRTAVVAHRQEWWTRKVTDLLTAGGVHVIGHTDVGADLIGWAVAEQPDLVVVEDRLAMVGGDEAVREIRRYCERTVVGAQVAYSDRVGAMLAAGAHAVHVRAALPQQVVDDLLQLVLA